MSFFFLIQIFPMYLVVGIKIKWSDIEFFRDKGLDYLC